MHTRTHYAASYALLSHLFRGTYLRTLRTFTPHRGCIFLTPTRDTHTGIRTHTNVPRSRLNIFITIFCDQKINSIMCYALIKLRLSIDHGYVLHLRRFRRLRIEITYCVGSSVRWPGTVALVEYFAFPLSLFLSSFFFYFIFFLFSFPIGFL